MATPSDLRSYLSGRGRASLADIAIGLDTSPDAARALLDVWETKQRVRRVGADCGKGCGGACCGGDPAIAEVYEWVGPPRPT